MNSSNGNFLDENGNPVNIVQLLKTGKAVPVENPGPGLHMAAHSGWFTDENGTPVNIVALIDAAIDEDSGDDEPAIAEAVSNWLNEHPEATTVQDGSITESKFSDALKMSTINNYVTPEMFGAVGDGVTDDSTAIQRMFDEVPLQTVCIFNGTYYCASGLVVTRAINVYMYGKCVFPNTLEFAFRVYGHGAKRNIFRLNLECSGVQDTWKNRNIIGLDMWACQENTFDIYIQGFKTGIRLLAGNTTSAVDCDYNKIFIRTIYNCQYAIFLTGLSGEGSLAAGTVSQNTFIGGRVGVQSTSIKWLNEEDTDDNSYWGVRSVLTEGRTNNNNTFLGVSFEGFGKGTNPYENRARVTLDFAYCMYLNCRFEGMTELRKTVSGIIPSIVIGGYNADGIYSYGATFVGNKKIELKPYANPVVIQRAGSGSKYLEIYSPNNVKISEFDDKTFYIPRVALLPNGTYYASSEAGKSVNLLFEYSAENAVDAMSRVQNKDWRMTNFGHILSKSRNGKEFDIQPIYTTVPANVLPGTMAFVNGKPQWYDGTQWVYADGTPVQTT